MAPLYVHCPHCQFPVVVAGKESHLPRRCRQCGQAYVPRKRHRAAGRTAGSVKAALKRAFPHVR